MRTNDEIVARIRHLEETKEDFFGSTRSDLLRALPFKDAKPWLKPEVTETMWPAPICTREQIIAAMSEYLVFALGKAEDHRGLSANRSIEHFRGWTWLLGDEDYAAIKWDGYSSYGCPVLKQVGERYDLPLPTDDWFKNMSSGKPCEPDCQEGCRF